MNKRTLVDESYERSEVNAFASRSQGFFFSGASFPIFFPR